MQQLGLFDVLYESSDEALAQLCVAETPWVKHTRNGRIATFSNLVPGRYRITCWHRRLPGEQQTVQREADRVTTAVMTLTVNTLPKFA